MAGWQPEIGQQNLCPGPVIDPAGKIQHGVHGCFGLRLLDFPGIGELAGIFATVFRGQQQDHLGGKGI